MPANVTACRSARSIRTSRRWASPSATAEPEDVDVAFLALPHGASAPLAASLLERGVPRHRHRRRLPPSRPRGVRDVVRRRARGSRAARAGGLRPHRVGARPAAPAPRSSPIRAATRPRRCWRSCRSRAAARSTARSSWTPSRASAAPGASAGADYLFTELTESTRAYGLGGHRHRPEIEQGLADAGAYAAVTFVPHLVPQSRGLLATCYLSLRDDLDDAALATLLRDAYDAAAVRARDRCAPGHEAGDRLEPRVRPRAARRRAARGRGRRRSTTSARARPARRSRT